MAQSFKNPLSDKIGKADDRRDLERAFFELQSYITTGNWAVFGNGYEGNVTLTSALINDVVQGVAVTVSGIVAPRTAQGGGAIYATEALVLEAGSTLNSAARGGAPTGTVGTGGAGTGVAGGQSGTMTASTDLVAAPSSTSKSGGVQGGITLPGSSPAANVAPGTTHHGGQAGPGGGGGGGSVGAGGAGGSAQAIAAVVARTFIGEKLRFTPLNLESFQGGPTAGNWTNAASSGQHGAGGGGGGVGDGSAAGGAGGGGGAGGSAGGWWWLSAPTISGTGIINVSGGNGVVGVDGIAATNANSGGGGGGGGGSGAGGGAIFIRTRVLGGGITFNVGGGLGAAGGSGGAGNGTGAMGAAGGIGNDGGAGVVYLTLV